MPELERIDVFLAVGAYLLGAVPFGLVLARVVKGIDVREHGSKNIGATNVARTAGRPLGLVTLLLDAVKGAAPVLLAQQLYARPVEVIVVVGLLAILGHVFPVYLGFRGGKGVATGAGVFAALAWLPALIAFGVFAAVAGISRVVSLGSMAASLALVAAVASLDRRPLVIGLSAAVAALIWVRHRGNLVRLGRGQEPPVG